MEEGTGESGEPASLASLVESTFVMSAAGSSYKEGLKAFISVVKEAYERGYTVPALTMEVSFVPTKVVCRVDNAGCFTFCRRFLREGRGGWPVPKQYRTTVGTQGYAGGKKQCFIFYVLR